MGLKILGCCALIVLVTACAEEKKPTNKYFDFDKLLDDQIELLAKQQRKLVKAAALGGPAKDTVFRPSKGDWGRELEAFRLLETINKPAFQQSYKIEDAMEDSRSNLKIHAFTSNKSRVASVRLYYHDDLSHLKKIECNIVQQNLLYSSRDELTMRFDDENGKVVLIGYAMNGYQKMILGDTVRFSVQGIIE